MTPLSKKLNKIQGTLLKKHDVMLSEYMDALELSPQVYGMWVLYLWTNGSLILVSCYKWILTRVPHGYQDGNGDVVDQIKRGSLCEQSIPQL